MTYQLVPRTALGFDPIVRTSSGKRRPPLEPKLPRVAVHYTGVDRSFVGTDPVREIQAIERWAASQNKPNEYNFVIPTDPCDGTHDDRVFKYAGGFQAAHSGGNNSTSYGVLFLNGTRDPFTCVQIAKFQWLLAVLRYFGAVQNPPEILPHGEMPGAATQCPGTLGRRAMRHLREPWAG